jgi:uncharacterized coiled-coil protein SlyX
VTKLNLDAIKEQMNETKKIQEKTLAELNDILLNGQESMDAKQLKELKKAIKTVETFLRL